MSIYLLNATRKISHRKPKTPLTKQQLFNMLVDYGAFKDSSILKFAVKNIINEGFWTKAANLYNNSSRDPDAISRLKHQIILTFGYADSIVDSILDAIWNVDEWNQQLDSVSESKYLLFEGIPIKGCTYEFVSKLINRGFVWDIYKRGLFGRFEGISDCEVYCNQSNSEVPLFEVRIVFPDICTEEDIETLSIILRWNEIERTPTRNNDIFFIETGFSYHYNSSNSRYEMVIRDPIGFNIMVESCLYNPHNNLATID